MKKSSLVPSRFGMELYADEDFAAGALVLMVTRAHLHVYVKPATFNSTISIYMFWPSHEQALFMAGPVHFGAWPG